MDKERRKYIRFPVSLRVEKYKENRVCSMGTIKDFSRDGIKAVFDDGNFDLNSYVTFGIQRPNREDIFPAVVEVMWKKQVDDKWEVGVRLNYFSSLIKSEILEQGCNNWMQTNSHAQEIVKPESAG
jgi:hypothetical protein